MRLILTLLLALAAAPAWAEWVKLDETAETTFYIRIDFATFRRDGNVRRVWSITDRKQRDKYGAMSTQVLSEYDCEEKRYRFLSISALSDSMAKGSTISSNADPGKWDYIPPGTMSESIFKMVCAL